ncbi:MAG: molybdate ABC transporter substrate-binding protein [Leptolyngbya sp. RL_3_1]|nr:molybdate ABC transporter substrate-binding protein [Leptolyngbya sp. RL_3_1]
MAGFALMVGLGAIACAEPPPISTDLAGEPITLTISAAASVQDALQEVQVAYQDVAPNVTVTYNFGSSGSLAQQIVQGAPSDVFLSASGEWMDELAAQGDLVDGSRRDLLTNAMVLIVAQDETTVADFPDLQRADVGRVAIGEPDSVPAGSYAKAVLTTLNLFDALQPKLVFAKDVRQVLAYVETGNVDAGLVYATDAKLSDRVQIVATAPADSHPPIVYPVAVVQDSQHGAAAQAFVDFLSSDTAVAIFKEYGFVMAE